MNIPRSFGDPEQNFWNLVNDAILCDVAAERQVEVTGPDAARSRRPYAAQPVEVRGRPVQERVNSWMAEGGIINDPIPLLGDHFVLASRQ
ncbi:MAG: hypothetical protein U5K33_09600 [Halofilum sp. (in: g-proteobacteria)]|nr:hypothetical protein [Halofilum sp. (in: g-proteobacteria)]